MDIAAACITLMMATLLLLVAQVPLGCSQKTVAVFPQVVPDRRQYFEYESIVISCEGLDGLTGWRVMRKIKGAVGPCVLKTSGPCKITSTFSMDSGEYWCEYQDMKRSNPINITVTAGSLILESPSHPVMEGDTVSLCCRNKTSNIKAEFYKDGLLMRNSSTRNMIIHSVSKSDEGLYKCSIPGADESAESWLAVGELHESSHPSHDCHPHGFIALRIIGTILLLALGLTMVLLHCSKERTLSFSSFLPHLRFPTNWAFNFTSLLQHLQTNRSQTAESSTPEESQGHTGVTEGCELAHTVN